MIKIETIYIGALSIETVHAITEIVSEEECVVLPSWDEASGRGAIVTRIGYVQEPYVETRSEYEIWKDEYEHSYYPERNAMAVEVTVSSNVKKIVIPHTVTDISRRAFQSLTDMIFEIEEGNTHYRIEDNKIVVIASGEVIWPYRP